MDATFLQQAARVTWGSELSPLLEGRAKAAARIKNEETLGNATESSKVAKQLNNVQRALSCPKCSALWIPGLNARAREQNHASANPSVRPSTRNKNKRSRQRMNRKEAEKFAKFTEKLKYKIGADFLPESQRGPAKYILYTCKNNCKGSLVLPTRANIKQERKNAAKSGLAPNTDRNTPATNRRVGISPLPTNGQKRNDKVEPPPSNVRPKPKSTKLSLSDFML